MVIVPWEDAEPSEVIVTETQQLPEVRSSPGTILELAGLIETYQDHN